MTNENTDELLECFLVTDGPEDSRGLYTANLETWMALSRLLDGTTNYVSSTEPGHVFCRFHGLELLTCGPQHAEDLRAAATGPGDWSDIVERAPFHPGQAAQIKALQAEIKLHVCDSYGDR